ncbi:Hypothetical predicted protein [Podarcis lilfordi]|uniref:Uncharacterized protein n=1 Tax=Podarcis lilfordi TaxID=74358 RepID=A0AA35KYV7_9SAUR|nr:Hypothetical predicted protein [Podarcis lilfordi]
MPLVSQCGARCSSPVLKRGKVYVGGVVKQRGHLYMFGGAVKKSKASGTWCMMNFRKCFKYNFMKNTEAFLLGITGTGITREDQKISLYATSMARALIARNWGKNRANKNGMAG